MRINHGCAGSAGLRRAVGLKAAAKAQPVPPVTPVIFGKTARAQRSLGLRAALLVFLLAPAPLRAQEPLSAIDWLSKSVTSAPGPLPAPTPAEPPVASGGALPSLVATTPLDRPLSDSIGLIAPQVSGLPKKLWGAGLTAEIAHAVLRDRMESLPALRQLFLTMLLAETEAPIDSGGHGGLLLARIDKLILLGALEQAAAIMQISGNSTPELFRRSFDVAILTGNENRACEKIRSAPGLSPTLQVTVLCLARAGNWDAAALTLASAGALGEMSVSQADLLARFLDPDLFEGEPMPPPPNPLTPLDWKLYEAVGENLPTAALPIAFAYAELGPQSGWKAQIEAAERLTRAGTIAPNVLSNLYLEREPAASGGLWDRVAAFQRFDTAMQSGAPQAIAATLPEVWGKMQATELEVPFAFLYGKRLAQIPLEAPASAIALRIGLLSPDYAQIAAARVPLDDTERFLIGLAKGDIKGLRAPDSMGRAIQPAFLSPVLSDETASLIADKRLGEALLLAIEEVQRGVEGNPNGVTRGLSLLRKAGLETVARRTALELMLLERRG